MGSKLILSHGSLFSGIGGFDLAAELMGWKNVFHCEIDEFCNKLLDFYWPKARSIKNIVGYEWEKWKGKVDILTGGFPCQPYSFAGRRLGKADPRHLWPEMLKAIRAIRPGWVVGENVRGIINWGKGLVFDEVQSGLEAEGYRVFPVLLPAAGVGAPHKRERIWFIASLFFEGKGRNIRWSAANPDNGEQPQQQKHCAGAGQIPQPARKNAWACTGAGDSWPDFTKRIRRLVADSTVLYAPAADTSSIKRCKRRMHQEGCKTTKQHAGELYAWSARDPWRLFPTESPLCSGDDGLSAVLDDITFSKWRRESIKAGGNAIVPQVALQIFKAIRQYILRRNPI